MEKRTLFAQFFVAFCLAALTACVGEAPPYPEDAEDFRLVDSEQNVDVKIESLRLYRDNGRFTNDGVTTDTRIVVRATRGAWLTYTVEEIQLDPRFLGIATGSQQVFLIEIPVDERAVVNVIAETPNGSIDTNSILINRVLITPLSEVDAGDDNPLRHPTGVAFHEDRTYLVDSETHQVYVYDRGFNLLQTIGSQVPGRGDHQFNSPQGIAVGESGLIWVADTGNYRVQVLNNGGNVVRSFGGSATPRSEVGFFAAPVKVVSSVLYSPSQTSLRHVYYVVDRDNHRIASYEEADSRIVAREFFGSRIGLQGSGDNQFNNPLDVVIGPSGKIFVADSGNHRVHVIILPVGEAEIYTSILTEDIQAELPSDRQLEHQMLPVSVAVNNAIRILYVSDAANQQVHLFSIPTESNSTDIPYIRSLGPREGYYLHQPTIRLSSDRMAFVDRRGGQSTIEFFNIEDYTPEEFALELSVSTNLFEIVNDTGNGSDSVTTDNRMRITAPTGSRVYFEHPINYTNSPTDDNVYRTYLTFDAPGTPVDYPINIPFNSLVAITNDGENIFGGEVSPLNFGFELGKAVKTQDVLFDYRLGVKEERLELTHSPDSTLPSGLTSTSTSYKLFTSATMDSKGNLYIADTLDHIVHLRVSRTDNTPTLSAAEVVLQADASLGIRAESGREGENNGAYFNHPSDIDVDETGNVYIADTDNHRILIVDPSLNIETIGRTAIETTANDGFSSPRGVEVDSKGNLYIADTSNHRIQIYNSNLEYIQTLGQTGRSGDHSDRFNEPTGVTLDLQDNLYVADTGNSRVQVFDQKRRFLQSVSNALLASPADIAIDRNHNIYVSSYTTNRIAVFNSRGKLFTLLNGSEGNSGGIALTKPKSLFFDPTGEYLYVSEFLSSTLDTRSFFVFRISQQAAR